MNDQNFERLRADVADSSVPVNMQFYAVDEVEILGILSRNCHTGQRQVMIARNGLQEGCGTVRCIAGLAKELQQEVLQGHPLKCLAEFLDISDESARMLAEPPRSLRPWILITREEMLQALDNLKATGWPDWHLVLSPPTDE